jgi:enoyl-CoA hydratase/carnithine racemase
MASSKGTIEYEVARGVAILALHNPPVNSLSTALRHGLTAALTTALTDPHVLAVVLCGKGRAFCAGHSSPHPSSRLFGPLSLTLLCSSRVCD